jgi:gliding motility-associated-like protein
MAKPDYARTSWAEDATVAVLANDMSTTGLVPGTVHIVTQPARGEIRVNQDGTITYTAGGRVSGRDEFTYGVCDIVGLCDSALVTIDTYDPDLRIPEGLSPNGDGLNDIFSFNGIEKYPNSKLVIYTRSGQKIYESTNYQNNWDGKVLRKGSSVSELVPTGVYYYILTLGGTNRTIKAFVYVSY